MNHLYTDKDVWLQTGILHKFMYCISHRSQNNGLLAYQRNAICYNGRAKLSEVTI